MQGTESTEKGMVMFTWGFDYADWSMNFLALEVVECPLYQWMSHQGNLIPSMKR